MKPIAVIRFSPTEGPGYLADFLEQVGLPWELVRIDAGDKLPDTSSACSGIAMMGGPMSVNDPLPWIPSLMDLIRDAANNDVPMLGHCLGGQMMAKALGGEVTDNKCMEKGWHQVEIPPNAQAQNWFGDIAGFTTFQWHYQTFSIPPGGTRILRNQYCENQAFSLGPHIGFQCHIEMTSDMVHEWCKGESGAMARTTVAPSVQSAAQILDGLESRVADLNRLAARVYSRWIKGLGVDS